jgi:DNA-binding NtrC family response regulator
MNIKKAILCVDDESIILMALKQELMESFSDKFLIETAMNAEEALGIIEDLIKNKIQIILILSDWLMPGLKGDEFLGIVKEKYPEIKCIIISGQVDEAVIEKAKEKINLLEFIPKPWNSEDLVKTISKYTD